MSTTAVLPQRNCKKSYHQRHDSDELHVFEAARYFSGANEVSAANYPHQKISRSGGRISLDIPMTRNSNIQAQTQKFETTTKEKKYKQPNSPGGRLASFLNSLFSQNSSKKKKSKSGSAQSIKDEDHESPRGRRKRRSSISHFRSSNTANNMSSADYSKSSLYSSSSSGFRTPPYSNSTCTKSSCTDFKKFLDPQIPPPPTLSKNNSSVTSSASQKELDIRKMSTDAWMDDDKFKFRTTTTTTTSTSNGNGFLSEKCKMFGNGFVDFQMKQSSEKDFRNFINEMDDGGDSDSSSDLFELPNYDLGCCYPSGLPVYETTHMDNINRGAPLTSCAI